MCGIYGIVKGKGPAPTAQAREWARLMGSLAALSTSRGMDSTGVMRVAEDGTVTVLKDAVPAWELMTNKDWSPTMTPDGATVATIGHTRLATHGAVTQANAHPFVFSGEDGDVTAGVHNGVISNHARLRVGAKVYAVDSANLVAALASEKVKNWRKILRQAEGTLALAIARVADGAPTIFLTRRGNPLWTARIAELGGATAFASTRDILAGAVKLSRLTVIEPAKELEEGFTYVFKNGALAVAGRWWKRPAPKPKKGGKNKPIGDGRPSAAERLTWGEEHDANAPGRALGSNGKEYMRCGSCLDWDLPHAMHVDGTRVLCARCHIAAESWPKGPKGKKNHWDGSRWGDGTKVAKVSGDGKTVTPLGKDAK